MFTQSNYGLRVTAVLAVGALSLPVMADEVEWSMATPWPGGPWLDRDAAGFVERVEELTEGRVSIETFEGGTLYSALEVTEGVQRGVAEMGHNWMAYDWGQDKTAAIFGGYADGLMAPEAYMLWMYKGGGLELWEEFRAEEFGVISFPCATLGTEIFLHSHKRVENLEDFEGLRMRTAGAWAEIASELGASTVIMAGGEVYGALERGVIDAAEWGSPEINIPTGFQDIAEYVVVPGIHQPGGFLECQVNQDAWAELSEHDQNMLKLAGKITVFESWLDSSVGDLDAYLELMENNEIVKLDEEFIVAARGAAKEWSDKQAEENPWFDRVLSSKRDFVERLEVWDDYRLPIGGVAD